MGTDFCIVIQTDLKDNGKFWEKILIFLTSGELEEFRHLLKINGYVDKLAV